MRTLAGSSDSLAVPTTVHCFPSGDSSPVIVSLVRLRRSQRGRPGDTPCGPPATSSVKSCCMRTPWAPVTMIAAYAAPCSVLSFTMRPAFAQGTTPGTTFRTPGVASGRRIWPVMEFTRAVMAPLPSSGRLTK
ncbi:hypothetical protein GCM10020220_113710 [Nonomuraea rubra]|uniref:hypothetical protein n=1 Tax=Nonomuraea rubra TaxID=46180 RepID=UPI0031EC1888